MEKVKPVFFMHQEGLNDLDKRAILDGASDLIRLARVPIEIIDFGVWRKDLSAPYGSVDWYVEQGRKRSRNNKQLNASAMQMCLVTEPHRVESGDHYDVFAVREDMYSGNTNFVIGLAQRGIGTTLSTYRFRELRRRDRYECIKTETIHELGHAFGLIPSGRTSNVEKSLGKHCTNVCTMRQGLTVPNDWLEISRDRLSVGALCGQCQEDLINYFRS